jgi:(R,R)-butanediol dehydrogenase/meso-butanediol dehydrogenase/diacetyl reductase
MKAAVLKEKGKFVVNEVPTPKPGPGQVLIKVICCGICGSDVHLMHFDKTPLGVTPGHEWVGRIAELGEGITNVKVGDRVVMHGYSGNTDIRPEMIVEFLKDPSSIYADHPVVKAGGFGEYLLWDANRLHRIPDNMTDEEAAFVDTLAVGLGAVKLADMKMGDTVLVIGGGPIGLSAVLSARAAGATRVIVSEPVEYRRKMALKMGADEVIDPAQGDARLQVLMQTGGGADIVLDCVGSPLTIQQSVDMAKVNGKVVLVGLTFKPAQILPLSWLTKSIHFSASMKGDSGLAIKMLSRKRMDISPMITGRVKLEDIGKGFEMAVDAGNHIKVLVYPE